MSENNAQHLAGLAVESSRDERIYPCRILVVDDDGDIRYLNSRILERSGYLVDTAEDGAAAWDALQFNSYHLLITDNHMPKMSGLELIEKLHIGHITMPVIMLTGTLTKEELDHPSSSQPAAILLKPCTSADLLKTVEKVLREIVALPARVSTAPTYLGRLTIEIR